MCRMTLKKLKVFWSIIIFNMIDMVHYFSFFKNALKFLFHYKSMFKNITHNVTERMIWLKEIYITISFLSYTIFPIMMIRSFSKECFRAFTITLSGAIGALHAFANRKPFLTTRTYSEHGLYYLILWDTTRSDYVCRPMG